MRGKTPQELARLERHRKRRAHRHRSRRISEVRPVCSFLGPRAKSAGGAGRRQRWGRGQNAWLERARLAIGAGRVANASCTGLLPDGGVRGLIDRACRRIPELEPGVVVRVPRTTRNGWASEVHEARACPHRRDPSRDAVPRAVLEQAFEGMNPRRAPARQPSPRPGWQPSRERTLGGSKASKWACRRLTGEPDLGERTPCGLGASATRRRGLA